MNPPPPAYSEGLFRISSDRGGFPVTSTVRSNVRSAGSTCWTGNAPAAPEARSAGPVRPIITAAAQPRRTAISRQAKPHAVVRTALRASEGYVWVYTEQPRWWTKEKLPPAYVEALTKARAGQK